MLAGISDKTRLIVICNPNNPTGTFLEIDKIEKLVKSAPASAFLIDECYFEFCGKTAALLIKKYDNIFITRTFSKTWGLPSIRLGTLISSKENIEDLLKVRGPYDINQFAEVAIIKAIQNPQYMTSYVKEVMNDSKPILEEFLKEKNILYWPSEANFLFTSPKNPIELEKELRRRKILVRPKNDPEGNLGLRISIGTLEQTKVLIKALEEIL